MRNIENDMYSPVYIQQLIRYEYGIYIKEKDLKYFHLFATYYWESVKGLGIYLNDVDFADLSKESKKDFIYRVFKLWTTIQSEISYKV